MAGLVDWCHAVREQNRQFVTLGGWERERFFSEIQASACHGGRIANAHRLVNSFAAVGRRAQKRPALGVGPSAGSRAYLPVSVPLLPGGVARGGAGGCRVISRTLPPVAASGAATFGSLLRTGS